MRYWIGVASKDHVNRGIAGGFSQLCHGKSQPLKRMQEGDWIVYYSPKQQFGGKEPCQEFTAAGIVVGEEIYSCEMAPGFTPNRRDVDFIEVNPVPIRPLLDKLSFIQNKQKWGYAFRYGHFEIPKEDFEKIFEKMI